MAQEFTVPEGYEVISFVGTKTTQVQTGRKSLFGLGRTIFETEEVTLKDTKLPTEGVADLVTYEVTVRGSFSMYRLYLYLASDRYETYPAMYAQTTSLAGGFNCPASEMMIQIDSTVSIVTLLVTLTFVGYKEDNPKVVDRKLVCRFPSREVLEATLHTLEPADTVTIAKLKSA